jgi:hypothetical protein
MSLIGIAPAPHRISGAVPQPASLVIARPDRAIQYFREV